MNIYIANLNFKVEDHDLRELFESFGEVSSAKVIKDRETGRSRGFGFVEMPDNASGNQAIQDLHQSDFQGKNISVSEARPRPPRENGGGNRGGGSFQRRDNGGFRGGDRSFNSDRRKNSYED